MPKEKHRVNHKAESSQQGNVVEAVREREEVEMEEREQ